MVPHAILATETTEVDRTPRSSGWRWMGSATREELLAGLATMGLMRTASLELLEKTQLPPAQARAILPVMELELANRDGALATKSDLREAVHDLRAEMQTIRTEVQAVRAELIGEIKGTVRWNFAFWVTQLAAMAAILKALK